MRHRGESSGKIKVSPAAACGDHELIQGTSLCLALLVHTASVPFTGGDCCGRDHHYDVLATGTRSGGGCNLSCCSECPLFRAIQTRKASEDAKE